MAMTDPSLRLSEFDYDAKEFERKMSPFHGSTIPVLAEEGYDEKAIRQCPGRNQTNNEETNMARKSAKASADGVYKIVEVIGSSPKSWEDAARTAVETAAKTLRDLRVAEITKLDMKIDDGKVVAYRARVSLSFKYQA